MKKIICVIALLLTACLLFTGCKFEDNGSKVDVNNTLNVGANLAERQPTPTDVDYSLERYNLIKRTYWVNGQREKANALPCQIVKPLGYIVLFTESGSVVGSFVVDGKVSSLNSFLTPDSEYYEKNTSYRSGYTDLSCNVDDFSNKWIADVDGSYGVNDNGIFFFTTDGKYIEWTGTYLYSDIPFVVDDPILKVGE
ncbi:MAG: hypothetical protein J6N18_01415 [Kiritimatiellae bacterium]|nr:hypothetical protein [Kiritimatiellia bacterium]